MLGRGERGRPAEDADRIMSRRSSNSVERRSPALPSLPAPAGGSYEEGSMRNVSPRRIIIYVRERVQ